MLGDDSDAEVTVKTAGAVDKLCKKIPRQTQGFEALPYHFPQR